MQAVVCDECGSVMKWKGTVSEPYECRSVYKRFYQCPKCKNIEITTDD
jgi:DNA-directed RNA polymerase subunit M/transcription elongation factor TFIIS